MIVPSISIWKFLLLARIQSNTTIGLPRRGLLVLPCPNKPHFRQRIDKQTARTSHPAMPSLLVSICHVCVSNRCATGAKA